MNENSAELYLYGYIKEGEINALDFVNQLTQLQRNYPKIKVRINSGGGGIFDGLTIFNALRNSTSVIETYVDGLAASMGSVIAMAGQRCFMSKAVMFMTHRASGISQGNANDMRTYAVLMERMEDIICEVYAEKTGLSREAAKAKYLTDSDRWLTAQEALNEKIIDGIYDAPQNIYVPLNLRDENKLIGIYNSYLSLNNNVVTNINSVPKRTPKELLNDALSDGVVTTDLYAQLLYDFKENTEKLPLVIDGLYETKISLVYSFMTWNELDKCGALPILKVKAFPMFQLKYREQFNKEYVQFNRK